MKHIILDRDGVINYDSDAYIKTVDEFKLLPGSLEALILLCRHNYSIAIATNQSGIARGYTTTEIVNAMHEKLSQQLSPFGGSIEFIAICPHRPDDNCNCRKPKNGLFLQIQDYFGLNSLNDIQSVGDSYRDLEAAMSVGAIPNLVRTGKGNRTLQQHASDLQRNKIPIYSDLYDYVSKLLA